MRPVFCFATLLRKANGISFCLPEGARGHVLIDVIRRDVHIDAKLPVGEGFYYNHNPFDLRNAHSVKPLYPIHQLNLRIPGVSGRTRFRPRGPGMRSKTRKRHRQRTGSRRGRTPVWNGGHLPLYKRFPKWPGAMRQWRKPPVEWCSLHKLRRFLEKGRLDARFPITQRHIHESGLVRVKRGIRLFNTNDRPFPYRIHIEVTDSDQSSIDAINHVGGSVTIVYRNALNMEAHLHPDRFEILPRTGRPNLSAVFALEKYRARGCIVRYIKPLWLLREEARIKANLAAEVTERANVRDGIIKDVSRDVPLDTTNIEKWKEMLLENFRIRYTAELRHRMRRKATHRR